MIQIFAVVGEASEGIAVRVTRVRSEQFLVVLGAFAKPYVVPNNYRIYRLYNTKCEVVVPNR